MANEHKLMWAVELLDYYKPDGLFRLPPNVVAPRCIDDVEVQVDGGETKVDRAEHLGFNWAWGIDITERELSIESDWVLAGLQQRFNCEVLAKWYHALDHVVYEGYCGSPTLTDIYGLQGKPLLRIPAWPRFAKIISPDKKLHADAVHKVFFCGHVQPLRRVVERAA